MSFKAIDTKSKKRTPGKHCLLMYGFQELEVKQVRIYAQKKGFSTCIEIKPEMVETPINACLEENFESRPLVDELEEKVILFSAVSDFELHYFIGDFKSLGLGRPIYACITETSKEWKFIDLVQELRAERAAFSKKKE